MPLTLIGRGILTVPAVVIPPAGPTLDPLNTSGINLSVDLLTGTSTGTNFHNISRSTTSHTSGKYYVEVTNITPGTYNGAMVLDSAFAIGATDSYASPHGAVQFQDGDLWNSGGSIHFTPWASTNDIVSIALDIDNSFMWTRTNGGNWNGNPAADPATGASPNIYPSNMNGILFLGISIYTGGSSLTINFGATAFTYTPPSGYGNW